MSQILVEGPAVVPDPSGTRPRTGRRHGAEVGWARPLWWAVPLVVVVVTVVDLPLLRLVGHAAGADDGDASGLARVVSSDAYRSVLADTVRIALGTALLATAVAVPLALWWRTLGRRSQRLAVALVVLPLWVSVVVRTYAWFLVLGRDGVVNRGLVELGVVGSPLRLLFGEPAVVVGCAHLLLPLALLPVLAALRSLDPRLERAAASCGAGPVQRLVRVVLPAIAPAALAGATLCFVLTLGFFVTPALLGGGRVTVVATLIERVVNRLADWSLAGALALVLLLAAWAVLWLSRRLTGLSPASAPVASAGPAASAPGSSATNAIGWVALAAIVAPVALVIPLSFSDATDLAFPPPSWSLRWYRELVDVVAWRRTAVVSLALAAQATVIATVLGVAAASGLVRSARRGGGALAGAVRGLLRGQALLPLLVPEIVVATGLYVLLARADLLGSWPGLVAAHVALVAPLVVTVVLPALAGVDERLELAARSCGAGPFVVARRVTLPLAGPAVATGALFAFVASFDLVVVNLFLEGLNRTLSVRLLETVEDVISPVVAAASVVLMATTAALAGLGLLVRRVVGPCPTPHPRRLQDTM